VYQAASAIRQQYGIQPDEKLLLFAGTLDYAPNARAVEDLYKVVVPALRQTGLKFRVIICGRNHLPAYRYLNDLSDPLVIMAGEVPSITPYFAAADVFINPVRSGGGIQTKNLDAIAGGCNTVCFHAQATGIPPDVCGSKLYTANDTDWEQFCRLVISASETNTAVPDSFFSYFDWERILQPLIHNLQLHD
jgi:polysaccharide biosynthesis protein PslH